MNGDASLDGNGLGAIATKGAAVELMGEPCDGTPTALRPTETPLVSIGDAAMPLTNAALFNSTLVFILDVADASVAVDPV